MLGRSLLLPPLFFFFWVATTGPTIGLEWLLEEGTSLTLEWGFFELSRQLNSSRLKYSISCITKDPTVPLVPISTGGCAVISTGTFLVLRFDLCMLCLIGLREGCRWREDVLCVALMGKFLWDWAIWCLALYLVSPHEFFASCSLSKVNTLIFLPGWRIKW